MVSPPTVPSRGRWAHFLKLSLHVGCPLGTAPPFCSRQWASLHSGCPPRAHTRFPREHCTHRPILCDEKQCQAMRPAGGPRCPLCFKESFFLLCSSSRKVPISLLQKRTPAAGQIVTSEAAPLTKGATLGQTAKSGWGKGLRECSASHGKKIFR